MQNKKLKKHVFIDGDFSMDINVSEEERTVYMNQTEISRFLGIGKWIVSRSITKIYDLQMGQVAENAQNCNKVFPTVSKLFDLETIKEIGQKYNPERLEKLENWLYNLFPENNIDIIDGDYEIVRYNQDNLNVPIRFDYEEETLWMTPKEMSFLFDTTERNINIHMANIFEDEELTDYSIGKESFLMGQTGQKYKVMLYNLDMILAVGYRVRSAKAVQFRKWASSVLKKHFRDSYYGQKDSHYLPTPLKEIDERLTTIERRLERVDPKNIIYYRNNSFDAYVFITILFSTAKNELFIIDPYADENIISALKTVKDGVKVLIVEGNKSHITQQELDIYHRSHPNVEIKLIEAFDEHDRFIFVDRKTGYMLGASMNTMGYHDFHASEIDDTNYIKQIIKKYIDD